MSNINAGIGTVTSSGIVNNGPVQLKRTTVADTAYTVLATDYLIAYTSLTATRAVTINTALGSATAPQYFIVKDETGNAGTSNITITGTVDGATGKVINTAYGVFRFYTNGTAAFTW